MGLFNNNKRNEIDTINEDITPDLLESVKNKWKTHVESFQTDSLYAYTKDKDGRINCRYYIKETDQSYICRADYVGKGIVSINDIMPYQKTLQTEDIVLPKTSYSIVLPEDNIIVKELNEFEQTWHLSDIHIEFVSAEQKYSFYFTGASQQTDVLLRFAQSNIILDFKKLASFIPKDVQLVRIIEGSSIKNSTENTGDFIFWRDDNVVYMVKEIRKFNERYLAVIQIPVSQILYYKEEGILRYEQQVYGGGSLDVNYTGALVGALLLGSTGALIGSRIGTGTNPIESKTIEVDSRIVYLLVSTKEGNTKTIAFSPEASTAMEWFLPEKEYSYVIKKRRAYFEQRSLQDEETCITKNGKIINETK